MPAEISVSLKSGAKKDVGLHVFSFSDISMEVCLDSADPLQTGRNAEAAVEVITLGSSPCGLPGEIIDIEHMTRPSSYMTMSEDGLLYRARSITGSRTDVFSYDLHFIREFWSAHPGFGYALSGITFMPGTEASEASLWWQYFRHEHGVVIKALLMEGTLNGVPTGREISLDPGAQDDPYSTLPPAGVVFDPTIISRSPQRGSESIDGAFFYVLPNYDLVYAVNIEGDILPGFPIIPSNLPHPRMWSVGLDAHSGIQSSSEAQCARYGDLEAFANKGRLEVPIGLQSEGRISRAVVTNRLGEEMGTETTLMEIIDPKDNTVVIRHILRSRVDPNGALYVSASLGLPPNGYDEWFVLRPAPLAPIWLQVGLEASDGWQFIIPPNGAVEIPLILDARWLDPGVYHDTLLVRPADGSAPLLVPVRLNVQRPVSADQDGTLPGGPALSAPYPNPARGQAELLVSLPAPSRVHIELFDVLGRRMRVLGAGPLPAGEHPVTVDAAGLPAGIYVIRATVAGQEQHVLARQLVISD